MAVQLACFPQLQEMAADLLEPILALNASLIGNRTLAEEQRQSLSERLVQLSPAEIDRLPHQARVQHLEFLQTLTTSRAVNYCEGGS